MVISNNDTSDAGLFMEDDDREEIDKGKLHKERVAVVNHISASHDDTYVSQVYALFNAPTIRPVLH